MEGIEHRHLSDLGPQTLCIRAASFMRPRLLRRTQLASGGGARICAVSNPIPSPPNAFKLEDCCLRIQKCGSLPIRFFT